MIAGISRKQLLVSIGVISVITFLLLFAPLSYKFSKNKSVSAAGWYSYDWNYRKLITIDHTKIPADQTEYPFLVSLSSDSDLSAMAQSDGDDILFTSADGTTKLSHEIERYISDTGELVAWVKIPLLSNISDTELYLYYDNSSCTSQQSANNVWSNDYKLVQHLNESSGTIYDSTSNNNDATQYGGISYSSSGKIANGVGVNGAEDHLRAAHSNSLNTGTAFSFEEWIKIKDIPADVGGGIIDISPTELDNNAKGALYPVDLDSDGAMDLIGSDTVAGGITWYRNDGSENFSKSLIFAMTNPYNLIAYDFDSDGDIDIAGVADNNNDVFVLFNDGNEAFTLSVLYTAWNRGHQINMADINSDGHMDILATTFYSNQWAWFENDGVGNFTAYTFATTVQTQHIDADDMDGDGDTDVVVTTSSGGDVIWLENDGSENFTSHTIVTAYNGMNSVYIVDLDGDGNKDILAARDGGSSSVMRVYWFQNDGSENFTVIDLLGYVRTAGHCLPIDMDGDGDIDIVGGSGHSDIGIVWWENNGSQVYSMRILKNGIYGASKPWPVDIDSDGDLDIVANFTYSSTIHSHYIWKNKGQGLINKGDKSFRRQEGVSAYVSAGGKIKSSVSDPTGRQCLLTSSAEVDDDTFKHVVVTWDGLELKNYINGSLDSSASCAGLGALNNSNFMTIGKGSDSIFDEVRYSSQAFDANFISTLYQNQNNPETYYITDVQEKGDTTDPINPTDLKAYNNSDKLDEFSTNSWHNQISPYFEWSNSSDAQSGIAGYFIYFGATADADPVSAGSFQTGLSYLSSIVLESGSDYYLRFVTRDRAGNDSEPETLFTYKYDSTAPSPPSYVNVSPVGCTTQSNFDFSWPEAVDEGGSNLFGYQYKRGTSGDTIDANQQLTTQTTAYQEGDNVFYVRSIDNAGNVSAWQTGIYCSTGVAHIIDGPSVASGPSSINVSWITDKPTRGTVLVYEGNEYLTEQSQGGFDNAHSVRVIGLEAEREYRYKITWYDQNSNTGESEWFNTVTETAPSVNNLEYEILSPKAANISFKTSQQSSVVLEYGSGELNNRVDFEGSGTQFSKQLTDLVSGTLYNVRVKATAIQDNTTFYGGTSFVTPPLPSISSLSFESDISGSTPILIVSWDTNVATTSSVFYMEDSSTHYSEISNLEKTVEHQVIINDLLDSSNYKIYVSGIDNFGNIVESDINTVSTPLDTRPPQISQITIETSNVGLDKQDKAQIAVSWRTDEPTTSQVEYGEGISGTEYTNKTTEDKALTTNHLVIIPDLTPSKPYHIRVISTDKGNNTTKSEDHTVIPGDVPRSALQIILNTFTRLFGWLGL